MELDRYYFKLSIVSLILLLFILFVYLNVNTKKSILNKELSDNTSNYIELKADISKLEIQYNKLTRNEILEKKAISDFEMRTPESSDIVRVKDE